MGTEVGRMGLEEEDNNNCEKGVVPLSIHTFVSSSSNYCTYHSSYNGRESESSDRHFVEVCKKRGLKLNADRVRRCCWDGRKNRWLKSM